MSARTFHVVVLGATGFTGGLVAEYLAKHLRGTETRWALAGRDRAKLEAVRARLVAIDPECEHLPIVDADTRDAGSLTRLARGAQVVLTTVGPYAKYGEPVVAACVEAGTHCVDLTGEPQYLEGLVARWHARAQAASVKLVSCCGFESVPPDLGVFLAVRALGATGPVEAIGMIDARGTFSGGTFASAMGAMAESRSSARALARLRAAPAPAGRRVSELPPRVRRAPDGERWLMPLPLIDPQIVLRSARLLSMYGPDFSFGHFVRVPSPLFAAAFGLGVGTAVAFAQLPPTLALMKRLGPKPGEGPSESQRAKGYFVYTVRASGDGRVARSRIAGGDPGYGDTAKMIAECALCLALDAELPPHFGVVTPVAAMGDALVPRLRSAGLTIDVG